MTRSAMFAAPPPPDEPSPTGDHALNAPPTQTDRGDRPVSHRSIAPPSHPGRRSRPGWQRLLVAFLSSTMAQPLVMGTVQAQETIASASVTNAYCQLSSDAVTQLDTARQTATTGEDAAVRSYQALLQQQANQVQRCRQQTWPQTQAIWLRLYPCDAQSGALDAIFDRILSRGYNRVYVEVFHDGQVLLPAADNPTAWGSVIRAAGYEETDLLAAAIAKGHERGLKVYAWMFTLNFGYTYSLRPGADQTLARNGHGETSIDALAASGAGAVNSNEVFIDPYSPQAKQDFLTLQQAVLARKPDGVLFDYIRYPLGYGAESVASQVQDLWIYSPAALQALYARATNQKGLELIDRYVRQGRVTTSDLSALDARYPQETAPLWQGRDPVGSATVERLQSELWLLTVAHAVQGVLDFLALAASPVQQQGIPAGSVFFPEANQRVGERGYDSRLQPWDRFSSTSEWHPMAYATCTDGSCVAAQVQRVTSLAPAGTQVMPVLAGTWGEARDGHPSLEVQMRAVRQTNPNLTSVSHFAYSWQEPQHDRDRKFCQL